MIATFLAMTRLYTVRYKNSLPSEKKGRLFRISCNQAIVTPYSVLDPIALRPRFSPSFLLALLSLLGSLKGLTL